MTEGRLHVLIGGGGLGGLALAHLLLQQEPNPPRVTVFERDEAFGSRNQVCLYAPQGNDTAKNLCEQGIVIGLRQEGCAVLESIAVMTPKLPDMFSNPAKVATPRDLVIMSATGRVLLRARGMLGLSLNHGKEHRGSLVDRSILRNALASNLPEGVIRWNAKVTGYEHVAGKVVAILDNGDRVEGDVLVGCDGARSQIRVQRAPMLTPAELGVWNLAGAYTVDAEIEATLQHFALYRAACTGLTRMSAASGFSMMSFVYTPPDGRARTLLWSLSFPTKDKPASHDALIARLLSEFPGVGVDVVVGLTPEESRGLLEYEIFSVLPETLKANGAAAIFGLDADSLVTLLGDAAHKTTTQAGLGATAAFEDAQDLAHALAGVKPGAAHVGPVLRAYEARMLKRAQTVVSMSVGNTRFMHTKRGPFKHAMINGVAYTVGCLFALVQGPGIGLKLLRKVFAGGSK